MARNRKQKSNAQTQAAVEVAETPVVAMQEAPAGENAEAAIVEVLPEIGSESNLVETVPADSAPAKQSFHKLLRNIVPENYSGTAVEMRAKAECRKHDVREDTFFRNVAMLVADGKVASEERDGKVHVAMTDEVVDMAIGNFLAYLVTRNAGRRNGNRKPNAPVASARANANGNRNRRPAPSKPKVDVVRATQQHAAAFETLRFATEKNGFMAKKGLFTTHENALQQAQTDLRAGIVEGDDAKVERAGNAATEENLKIKIAVMKNIDEHITSILDNVSDYLPEAEQLRFQQRKINEAFGTSGDAIKAKNALLALREKTRNLMRAAQANQRGATIGRRGATIGQRVNYQSGERR